MYVFIFSFHSVKYHHTFSEQTRLYFAAVHLKVSNLCSLTTSGKATDLFTLSLRSELVFVALRDSLKPVWQNDIVVANAYQTARHNCGG